MQPEISGELGARLRRPAGLQQDLPEQLALFLGYVLSGRRRSAKPARIAVVLSATYIVLMMLGTSIARSRIQGDSNRRELMVSPIALNPFARQVVLVENGAYRTGQWSVRGGVEWGETIPINRDDPAVAEALRKPEIQPFIHWSRFPIFIVNHYADGRTAVEIADARYTDRYGGGWASRTVVLQPK